MLLVLDENRNISLRIRKYYKWLLSCDSDMVNNKLFSIMEENIELAKKSNFKSEAPNGYNEHEFKPFFVGMTIKSQESIEMQSVYGHLFELTKEPLSYVGRIQTRMGDPVKGGAVGSFPIDLPLSVDAMSNTVAFWEGINVSFWKCVDSYNNRFGKGLGRKNKRDNYLYFSKEHPEHFIQSERKYTYDLKSLEELLNQASKNLMRPDILSSNVSIDINHEKRYYVNSEGAKIFTTQDIYVFTVTVRAIDDDGFIVPMSKKFHCSEPKDFPTIDQLVSGGEVITRDLLDIIKSPFLKNGGYPTIFDSENHGVLWHEDVGHALEGNGMQKNIDDDSKFSVFEGKMGELVAPEFITLLDDPTLKEHHGHYLYDEEGVKTKPVTLIENGILKNYLHSRQSAGFFDTISNGHARSEGVNDPEARMSNLIVKSSKEVSSFAELKENLVKYLVDNNKPYGLIMKGTDGGITLPDDCFFNTYPTNIFKVNKKGEEQRVRGVYIVGTPYQTLQNILITSNNYLPFNGYCGSESGWVPSTEIAPDVLLNNVDVNRIPRKEEFSDDDNEYIRQPVINLPRFTKDK
ncbi:MAG: TldD/PmbA family protein [Candidatus Woesearchaeota archaeon]